MACESANFAHDSLTRETNHQRGAVIAFGGSCEIFDAEMMRVTDSIEFIVEYRLFIAVYGKWRSTSGKFLEKTKYLRRFDFSCKNLRTAPTRTLLDSERFELLLLTDCIRLFSVSPSSLSRKPMVRWNWSLIIDELTPVSCRLLFIKCSKNEIWDEGLSETENKRENC